MATTVAQHTVATFTSPVNGTTPIDANTVRGNDNTIRTAYNDHDSDPGIHLQSSTLASRPIAGTTGRKWLSADSGSYRLFYDDGSNWQELSYLASAGGTVSGNLSVTGTLNVTGAATFSSTVTLNGRAYTFPASETANYFLKTDGSGNLSWGTLAETIALTDLSDVAITSATSGQPLVFNGTSWVNASAITAAVTGNASTATALQTARTINGVSFNGTANITVTADAGTLTGTTLNSTVTGSSLTSVGTLSSLTVSGNLAVDTNTLYVDAVNNRVGVGTASPGQTFHVAGNTTITGNVGIGSLGPVSKLEVVNSGIATLYIGYNNTSENYFDANTQIFRNGSGTEWMRLASGNLGLGVTPSAWASTAKAFQFKSYSALFESVVGRTSLAFNARESSSGSYAYLQNEYATMYQQVSGIHSWYTAPSGTAGNAITFTQAMTLDASGNLLVGTTSTSYGTTGRGLIEINGSSNGLLGFKVAGTPSGYVQHSGTDLNIINQTATGTLALGANNATRWNVVAAGHFAASVDNTYDIGASAASRPRSIYAGTSVVSPRLSTATAGSFGTAFTATAYQVYADAVYGAAIAGYGSTSDVTILGRNGNVVFTANDTSGIRLGFYGTAPQGKPTITGSRGGNAALANLLTALANLGLLIDSSTV